MKRHTRRLTALYFFCSMILLTASGGLCQEIPQKVTVASSPNPVGSGARAIGMGGAFIAVADDATAASWNPAGLTQLRRPEVSIAYSYFKRRDDFSSSAHPESNGMQETSADEINYLSAAYPFQIFRRNMIVSINYQYLYAFDRNLDSDFISLSKDKSMRGIQHMNFKQRGKLAALSPAYAIQITPNLSLGATLNVWTDKLFWRNGWTADTRIKGALGRVGKPASSFTARDYDRYHGFSGLNMNLGLLWDVNSLIRIGAVVKTPFTGELKHDRTVTTLNRSPSGTGTKTKLRIHENVDMSMPCSYGIGTALRFTDEFTLSFDVFRTEWSHFKLEDEKGMRKNAVTGKPSHESKTYATHQVRLGGEYLFVLTKTVIPLRAGVFYDPEPSEKSPEDFYGFSLGSGFSVGNLIFDCAYQFRFGKGVDGDVLDIPSAKADVKQHLFLTSFIYHF